MSKGKDYIPSPDAAYDGWFENLTNYITRKAVPYGDNGCLLNFTWGLEKVTDYAALTQSKLMTRTLWPLTLPPEAEGNFLLCSTRWQNERGELGPWGEIQPVVIA
ncbi:MAG: hypothetical protein LBU17_07480 [Treponema sp.]|jgi:hypothetical protein|nr:hypothetical protein [Treponema sp.]